LLSACFIKRPLSDKVDRKYTLVKFQGKSSKLHSLYIVNSIFATPQHMIALKTTIITGWGVAKFEFGRLLPTVVVFRH